MTQSKFFDNINCWDDYVEAQKHLNNKEKGNTFELLTKLYFQINPVYNFYDNVWLLEEVPEKTLKEIGLPRQDLGVDLIAQLGDQYHAIQCKYHSDKHQAVTYKEVSTFLSAIGQCDKITMGYICSSANVTSKNYERIKKKPISKILADTWENLSDDFFKNIKASLKSKPLKLEVFKPRDHQKDALNKAIEYFKNNDRGKLILPCGSGKSLTGFWITRQLNSKNILIAVPSLSLIKQTLDVYLGQIVARKEKVKWLCICSDDGIGKSDDVALLTEDLGVPCVTDPIYISNWLKNNENKQKIIFTTYQSGKLIAEISKKQKLNFDLGIFDEAHKTVGSELSLFSHLLFEKNININKRVFMTATERFYSGTKDDIVSMDDPDIYGDVFCKMTFKDAIEKKLLTDYKIITLDIKESEISDFIIKNGLVSLSKKWKNKTDARSLASMIALRKLMEKYPINNAVSFHSSIEKAQRNSEIHSYITKNYGFSPITTYTVSGKQSTSLRNDIVSDFANTKKALITNARCLTEGVDVPNIDCIVFADPKKSKIDIVQALGRALRKKEGKEWGYVVLPVVYDNNHEIDNESFNDVVSIIRGLAANDERIIEYFQTKTLSNGGGNRPEGGSSIFEMIEENDLIDKLQIRVWEKLSRFNWMPFAEAKSFARSLKLPSFNSWKKWKSSSSKEINIPVNCDNVYKNDGWISWGDFLGHSYIATQKREYAEFKDARNFARNLKLNSWKDWGEYCKSGEKPENIPQSPNNVYKNDGWISFGDWLGTGRVAYKNRSHISYNEAKKIVKKLNISSSKNWKLYYSENEKIGNIIPKYPSRYYKNKGWISWRDFLGHTYIATNLREYLPYNEALKYSRKLGCKSISQWDKLYKAGEIPLNIPRYPEKSYKDSGWENYEVWLNYVSEKQNWVSFNEARKFARSLNLKSYTDWEMFAKTNERPKNIPMSPRNVYRKKGWISSADFLGIEEKKNITWVSYQEARNYVKKINVNDWKGWKEHCSSGDKPSNIPADPYSVYKNNGWVGADDFFNKISVYNRSKDFLNFEQARKITRKLGLKSAKEWRNYSKENLDLFIPATADRVYKNKGWISWGDFLGYEDKHIDFLDFKSARDYVKKLKIGNWKEWKEFCKSAKKPKNIPSYPNEVYKNDGFISFSDFVGKIDPIQDWLSYEDAKAFVKDLNLKNWKEWDEFCKSGKKPANIPNSPKYVYKNKGWIGISDFLGKE